jgi:hypothetical protein
MIEARVRLTHVKSIRESTASGRDFARYSTV